MSLSVERLKELGGIMSVGNPGTMFEVSEDVAAALRELIAIKETKPEVYALDFGNGPDTDFCYRTEDEVVDAADGLPLIIGLIRKPE